MWFIDTAKTLHDIEICYFTDYRKLVAVSTKISVVDKTSFFGSLFFTVNKIAEDIT